MKHILLVDDEVVLRTSLTFTLQQHGFRVTSAPDGRTGLRLALQQLPDLVVLDITLPDIDGLELCRRLRQSSSVPVIMLTARRQEGDKVYGLKLGADDYVTKPFSSRELIARIGAVLRRRTSYQESPPPFGLARPLETRADSQVETAPVLQYGPLRLDPVARGAWKNDQLLNLSPKEFQLLWVLMQHQGQALSRDELITSVWGNEFMGDAKTLGVHIHWLRTKIESDAGSPTFVKTVRGYGYRFG